MYTDGEGNVLSTQYLVGAGFSLRLPAQAKACGYRVLLPVAFPGVESLRFLDAEKFIAVGIDLLELLGSTEKFTARHIAVAIAVHVREPGRDFHRCPGGGG